MLRLLAGHPEFEIAVLTADSSAGRTVGAVHQNLAGQEKLARLVFESHHALKQADCDLVFLAMPSGQSAALAASLPEEAKVVDLGPDFRLSDDEAWTRHYDGEYAGRWVTGLPELDGQREQVKLAKNVAAPGCYSTAAILAYAPLAKAGLIETDDLVVVAASGTSGAGKSLRTDLLASEVMGSAAAYQVAGAHRHTPEIEQALSELVGSRAEAVRVSFTPVLVPMPRGILATCTARLASSRTDTPALIRALRHYYDDEPFVTVLHDGVWPATGAVAGSNCVQIQAAVDHRAGRAVIVAALDNLGKGAAGQAVQNANLMLGLPEAAGLTSIGVAP